METLKEKKINIDSWELTSTGEKLYSEDFVIDAYLKGKKDGLEQTQKVLVKQLEDNIVKAGTHTGKLIKYLLSQDLKPLSAHLRLGSIDRMKVLITLSENDFVSDKITDVYDHVSSMEDTVSEDLYKITFNFTYEGEKFNIGLLESDGYVFEKKIGRTNEPTVA